MNMKKYIPEYEKMTKEKMTPELVRFVEQLDVIGKKFENKGHDDSKSRLPAACDESFLAWGKKAFFDDPEMAESMSTLMKLYYMDGYNRRG